LHAAEGYLLGDLTSAERNAFEDHYADCDTCFADLRDGRAVIAGVAAYAAEENARRGGRSWFAPLFAAAASAVIAVSGAIGYQQLMVVNPLRAQLATTREHLALQMPRMTYELPMQGTRAPVSKQMTTEVPSGKPFKLHFVAPDVPKPPVTCSIVDERGQPVYGPRQAATAGSDVNFDVLEPDGLTPGDYTLTWTDAQKSDQQPVRFKVVR
jgi:hypothetical protein